jgi:hypothetical protein
MSRNSWQNLYITPASPEEREKMAIAALRAILDENLLPLGDLEKSAMRHILESVSRRVKP